MVASPALAMPVDNYHPHGVPASAFSSPSYQLPSDFRTDAQSGGIAAVHYSLPQGFKTDAQTKAPAVTTAPASEPVTVVRNIPGDTDHTLAIVLASAALGIALCGTAFGLLRVTRIQRRVAGITS
jgi:hypothetical protein